jgi:hypothetical protein
VYGYDPAGRPLTVTRSGELAEEKYRGRPLKGKSREKTLPWCEKDNLFH